MEDDIYDIQVKFLCIPIPLIDEPTIRERKKRKDSLRTKLGLSGKSGDRVVTVLCHIRKTRGVRMHVWEVVVLSGRSFQNTKHSGPKTLEAWKALLSGYELVPGMSIDDEAVYNAMHLTR